MHWSGRDFHISPYYNQTEREELSIKLEIKLCSELYRIGAEERLTGLCIKEFSDL